ncbi:MAG TPA: hypothetical protein ENK44_01670 [Caldithrix abyssi]|uniref:O-antigen ligase-related domain-containing protein n=1 Tax=Caldithrix abyssi TaxID=187145 RepID=A0A7V4TZ95_CALAY|nr:hypothetical protein [Caldithrix abyssi]
MKELLYALFTLSVLFKVILNLSGINLPVNITLILVPFLLMEMWISWVKKQKEVEMSEFLSIILLIVFWGWMILTSFYSPANSFKVIKPILFLLNILMFVYPVVVKLDYRRYFKQFIFIASMVEPILVILVPLLLFGDIEGSRTFYLALGQISGVIVLLVLVLIKEKHLKLNLKWLFIILLHLLILVANPARGAVVFTVLLLILWTFVSFYKLLDIKFIFILMILFIAGGLVIFNLFQSFPEYGEFLYLRMHSLIKSLFSENSSLIEISTFKRLQLWAYSYKMIFENNLFHFFFGYGIGSFGVLFSGYDGRLYPHNMFLETWFELGFIGLLILFLFLLSVVFVIIKKKNYYFFFPILITFLGAMKSGSLPDLRLFFSMITIAMTYQVAKSTNSVKHYD